MEEATRQAASKAMRTYSGSAAKNKVLRSSAAVAFEVESNSRVFLEPWTSMLISFSGAETLTPFLPQISGEWSAESPVAIPPGTNIGNLVGEQRDVGRRQGG